MLSGWSTKGELACACCHRKTRSKRLKYGHKYCYMGHRRYLPHNHPWRQNKSSFDNTKELDEAPKPLSGYDVLEEYECFEQIEFGNLTKKRKRCDKKRDGNWKKKSIFFELPYWKTLVLRHNLDVMHIEKNVFDNILGTLLNLDGKTKDNLNARLDLQLMGIKKGLHPRKDGNKLVIPIAKYTLSKTKKENEKELFCQFLKNVKMPDSYSSNIARCVHMQDCKIYGLKSHDCHVLLERLLPLAIRELLPKEVYDPLINLSIFFGELCSKELKVDILDHLEAQIAVTLCKLEMVFPPAFFDIMVHLTIHLAHEAKLAEPVQYNWMYSVERLVFS